MTVRYALKVLESTFPPLSSDASRAAVDLGDFEPLTADDLGLGALDPIRSVIDRPTGDDGSKDALRCAGDMLRDGGFTDEQIVGVLMHEANAVSDHIHRQADPRRAALRVLSKVKAEVAGNGQGDTRGGGPGSNAGEGGGCAPAPSFVLLDPGMWEGVEVPPRRYVIQALFLSSSLAGFTGPGAVGKSLLGQQACTAVAAGVPFLGMATTQGNAGYFTAEDDTRELHERQVAICEAQKLKLSDLSGKLYLASMIELGDKALVRSGRNDQMTPTTLLGTLREAIVEHGLTMVVLDNAGHFFGADENVRAHVVAFLGLLNKLALETSCAIVLISHPNKSGATYSGSTAWQNQIRVQAHLSKPDNEPDSNIRELRLEKANYSPPSEATRMLWHRGAFRLESDVPADDPSRSSNVQLRQNEIFNACLAAMTAQQRAVSDAKTAGNYAPKVFARMPAAMGMSIADFERTMERLLGAGTIERGPLDFHSGNTRNRANGLRRAERQGGHNEPPM